MFRLSLFCVMALLIQPACAEMPIENHPLVPVLRQAYGLYDRMGDEIEDYTCILNRQERVGGRLQTPETLFVKVRHQRLEAGRVVRPFSVYLRFLTPAKVKDREVVYVHGQNDGKLIVRNGGIRFSFVTTALPPDSPSVLKQNRYPITEIGVKNLTRRLIQDGENELQYSDCQVKTAKGARINDRPCTLIQVTHPTQRESLGYYQAQIFIDDELQIPVRYAAYDWPENDSDPPKLIEQYTYTHIKLNVGLTDSEFDHRNEKYQFLKSFKP